MNYSTRNRHRTTTMQQTNKERIRIYFPKCFNMICISIIFPTKWVEVRKNKYPSKLSIDQWHLKCLNVSILKHDIVYFLVEKDREKLLNKQTANALFPAVWTPVQYSIDHLVWCRFLIKFSLSVIYNVYMENYTYQTPFIRIFIL